MIQDIPCRVLVCGGRDFSDWELLKKQLNQLHSQYDFSVLIYGGARGADTLAATWAAISGVSTLQFLALWQTNGRSAGPIRNQQMIDEGKPNLCIAFKGGKGTSDMVARAESVGIPVIRIAS